MAKSGLPGISGFVGEFLVILAAFKAGVWFAFFAGTTLVLRAPLRRSLTGHQREFRFDTGDQNDECCREGGFAIVDDAPLKGYQRTFVRPSLVPSGHGYTGSWPRQSLDAPCDRQCRDLAP